MNGGTQRSASGALMAGLILMVASAWAGPGDTQISSLPYTITLNGRYVVTRNLFLAAPITMSTGILVQADCVSIDLNGFTLDGSNVAHGIVQEPGYQQLTVLNGFIRNCAQAIRAPGSGNRFKDLGVAACAGGITAGNAAVVEGCILGRNTSAAGLSLIMVGEGSRVDECLLALNSGSTAFEGIGCGKGAEVRRVLFVTNNCLGGVSYLVQGADLVEQVLAHDNTRVRHGIMSVKVVRDSVISGSSLGSEMELFTDCKLAERCVAYDNSASLLGAPRSTGFFKTRKAVDCVATRNTSTDPAAGAGFKESDTLGCAAYANAGDGFISGASRYSVAFTNVQYGFFLGEKADIQNCLAVANYTGFKEQALGGASRFVDNHAARNQLLGSFMDLPGTIGAGNSAQGWVLIGGSAKGGDNIMLTGGTTINTNNAWANFSW